MWSEEVEKLIKETKEQGEQLLAHIEEINNKKLQEVFKIIEEIDFPAKTFIIGNYRITIEKLEDEENTNINL